MYQFQHRIIRDASVVRPRCGGGDAGRNSEVFRVVTNRTLYRVATWMEKAKLSLTTSKTEAVILTTDRGYTMSKYFLIGKLSCIETKSGYVGYRAVQNS